MDVLLLERDGRCIWLENKVLKGFMPMAIANSVNPFAKKLYVIVDWISNDHGRVGVDLKWFKSLGVPAVATLDDLPKDEEIKVINTGYDSIVHEEKRLLERGLEMIDKPCPFIRNVRKLLEDDDGSHQIVLLCEPNHIIVKNFASLFPPDLLLVQMDNYSQIIAQGHSGKPFRLIPYVTFLQSDAQAVMNHLQAHYPGQHHLSESTACIWIKSKASPIVEINQLPAEKLAGVKDALLISTAGTTNKSVVSMEKSLEARQLRVVNIGSFWQFYRYARQHPNDKVLLVRSPIPNQAEAPILAYVNRGLLAAFWALIKQTTLARRLAISLWKTYLWCYFRLFPQEAKARAEREGILKTHHQPALIASDQPLPSKTP